MRTQGSVLQVDDANWLDGLYQARDGQRIPKCSPCSSVVFLMPPGPSVRFRVFFWGGEYVCPSYGLLKFVKSAKLGRKSVHPFVKKLRNPFLQKKSKKVPKV